MSADISFERLASVVELLRRQSSRRAVLVALTGIDGCGKGYVTAGLARALGAKGHRVASLNVDGWLNLPATRFSDACPAEHFYRHAIRFDEMFDQLVLPLRDHGSVRVETQFAEETATQYRPQVYAFADVGVILLEGIYLLKRDFRPQYDLSIRTASCGTCHLGEAASKAGVRRRSPAGLRRPATCGGEDRVHEPLRHVFGHGLVRSLRELNRLLVRAQVRHTRGADAEVPVELGTFEGCELAVAIAPDKVDELAAGDVRGGAQNVLHGFDDWREPLVTGALPAT